MMPETRKPEKEQVFEFTKTLRSDGRGSIKILVTYEAKLCGLQVGDEVVVTLRRRT